MTSKVGKLPLETEPVSRNTTTILTPGNQTFVAPFSSLNYTIVVIITYPIAI